VQDPVSFFSASCVLCFCFVFMYWLFVSIWCELFVQYYETLFFVSSNILHNLVWFTYKKCSFRDINRDNIENSMQEKCNTDFKTVKHAAIVITENNPTQKHRKRKDRHDTCIRLDRKFVRWVLQLYNICSTFNLTDLISLNENGLVSIFLKKPL
jgi:hypothetical protein